MERHRRPPPDDFPRILICVIPGCRGQIGIETRFMIFEGYPIRFYAVGRLLHIRKRRYFIYEP